MISYFTDGSASPNPGPGGFAVIKDGQPHLIGGEPLNSPVDPKHTTNIRMEGLAIMTALTDFLSVQDRLSSSAKPCHPELVSGSSLFSSSSDHSTRHAGAGHGLIRGSSNKKSDWIPDQVRNDNCDCTITTDSEFWINVLTKWAPTWEQNGWHKKGGIKNLDIVRPLLELYRKSQAKLIWTRGHVGTELNELADEWANRARQLHLRDAIKADTIDDTVQH